MRVGIVGAGSVFSLHADAFVVLGVPLAGIADVDRRRAEEAAARYHIPFVTTDWRELIDRPDVDVVDVCTPPKFHREPVIAALQAGKHVICEKPLAPNLAETDQILQAAETSRGKLTVVHQLRFSPIYRRLKWLVDGGHLGKVCHGRCSRYDAPPGNLVSAGVWGQWNLTGGGVLMTKAIHQLDLLLWLLGDVKRVQAMMGTFLFPIESEDHVVANLEFEQGALVSVCVSGYSFGEELLLVGDNGLAGQPWRLHLRDAAARQAIAAELDRLYPLPVVREGGMKDRLKRRVKALLGGGEPPAPVPEMGHLAFLRASLKALQGEGRPPVTPAEARKAVELCTAIYTAALTQETVELPLDSSARYYEGIQHDDYCCTR